MKNIIKKYLGNTVAVFTVVCIFTVGYLRFRNAIPDKEKVIQEIYNEISADNKGHVFYEASFPIDDPFEESRKVLYDSKSGEIVGYGVLE